jgi:hypothetical protein
MRNYAVIALLFLCASASAQLRLPLKTSNEISPVLSKVITDFPNDFIHIKGELLEEQPSIINYGCVITMKGMQPIRLCR